MRELGAGEVSAWLASDDPPLLVDVREPWELEEAKIAGTVHIPLGELPAALENGALPKQREIVVLCHHGGRSLTGGLILERAGYSVVNLTGGIDGWSRDVDPSVPTY